MCTWMHKQKCVRCIRQCHCVVNHNNTTRFTEVPHLNVLLSLAEKPQQRGQELWLSCHIQRFRDCSHTGSIMDLPGCKGLLLPCVELVLDDFEDLLLVGRLLLPVKVMTGGSTAAGGTCTKTATGTFAPCIWDIFNVWQKT